MCIFWKIVKQQKLKYTYNFLNVFKTFVLTVYTDNGTQIPKNASVIVRRTRSGPKEKAMTAAYVFVIVILLQICVDFKLAI